MSNEKNEENKEVIEIRIMSRPGIGRSGLVAAIHNVLAKTYKLPVVIGNDITKQVVEGFDGFDREEMMRALPDRIKHVWLHSVNRYDKAHKYSASEEFPAEVLLDAANQQVEFLRRSLKKILTVLPPEDADNEASAALKHSLGNAFDEYIAKPLYPNRPFEDPGIAPDFKPTHEVIEAEPGTFVFSVGVKLQHIGNGYYKSQYGQRKHVEKKYLRELDPKEERVHHQPSLPA